MQMMLPAGIVKAKALADVRCPARFECKTSGSTVDLYIYDAIGEGMFGGGISPSMVQKALAEAKGAKTLNVWINSPGGDVFDGVAIYNQIARFGAAKKVCVDGLAASAASVVAMAGDEITMAVGSQMMVHEAWGMAIGNGSDMREMADLLDKVTADSVLPAYGRTGQTPAKLAELLRAETWMSAEEAKALGFADTVLEAEKPAKAAASIRQVPEAIMRLEMNALRNRLATSACAGGAPGLPGNRSSTQRHTNRKAS
jgi:ATP-dependent Clp protease, protease subunit